MCDPKFRFDEGITYRKFKPKCSTHAVYVIGELKSANCVRSFFLQFLSNSA